MQIRGINIDAHSVAGLGTSIILPGHNLAFDMGICFEASVACDYVFITHGHMDHIAHLAMHCGRRALKRATPPTYVVGPENFAAIEELFAAYRKLDNEALPHELVVMAPGEELSLSKHHTVKAVRAYHRVPSQGYVVYRTTKSLKPEYVGTPGRELAALRQKGVDLDTFRTAPEVAFTGDSVIDIVDREEDVRRAKVLIMEVTYLTTGYDHDITPEESRRRGHIHLDDVAARADLFENDHILLTHFSPRYSPKVIQRAIGSLPESLRDRVTPLLDEAP